MPLLILDSAHDSWLLLIRCSRDAVIKPLEDAGQMEMLVIAVAVAGYFFATRTKFSESRPDGEDAIEEFGHR